MDIMEFGTIMTTILMAGWLVFVFIASRTKIQEMDLIEKRRVSLEKAKLYRPANAQPVDADLAPWVAELITSLGLSPDLLFQEEIPPELIKILPAVQAFVKNGGVTKLLGQIMGGEASSEGESSKGYI